MGLIYSSSALPYTLFYLHLLAGSSSVRISPFPLKVRGLTSLTNPKVCTPSIEGPPDQLTPKESCSVTEDGSILVTSSVKLPAMPVEFQSKFKARLQEGMCDYQGAFSRGYARGIYNWGHRRTESLKCGKKTVFF